MKRLINALTKRHIIIAILIIIQLIFMISLLYQLSVTIIRLNQMMYVLSVIIIIYLLNKNYNPSFKLAWSVLILALPLFGGVFYLLFGNKKVPKQLRKKMLLSIEEGLPLLTQDEKVLKEAKKSDLNILKLVNFVQGKCDYPIYKNTKVDYFKLGEDKFKSMVKDLEKAEKFIFLEYFIVEEGIFWNTIESILEKKVKDGVSVKVMYDDAGCMAKITKSFKERLISKGIECCVFNPLKARLVVQMNNRDHRKICVIDNRVAYVGGINLADEYINKKELFGHWKDTAVRLEGEAVWSFTVMFLQFWHYLNKFDHHNYLEYKLSYDKIIDDGFVQPFSDSPTDDEDVGLSIHMNMINSAQEYIYIQSPYLIISFEMQNALCLAAKNGVDVCLCLPHIPDKWYVHWVSQSFYRTLISAGVKIYEYTPGFMHSKMFIADDKIGLMGTVNMDYRSYYMHYECGTLIYKHKILKTMKRDFLDTLEVSNKINIDDVDKTSIFKKVAQALLSLFSSLM
ncbi:MAG: cardiolipin synthase [Anaerorhabdus sp.]